MDGWIKLMRNILDDPIFQSEKGLKVWIWCLCRAFYKSRNFIIGNKEITIKAGQFLFGRNKASEELNMSPSTVRNIMNLLKEKKYIDVAMESKYSLITIIDWKIYQEGKNEEGQVLGQVFFEEKGQVLGQQNNTKKNINNNNTIIKTVVVVQDKIVDNHIENTKIFTKVKGKEKDSLVDKLCITNENNNNLVDNSVNKLKMITNELVKEKSFSKR